MVNVLIVILIYLYKVYTGIKCVHVVVQFELFYLVVVHAVKL